MIPRSSPICALWRMAFGRCTLGLWLLFDPDILHQKLQEGIGAVIILLYGVANAEWLLHLDVTGVFGLLEGNTVDGLYLPESVRNIQLEMLSMLTYRFGSSRITHIT